MVKRITKKSDGLYHVKGKSFPVLEGSRAQVHHGTAYKTSGGLTKSELMKNKNGRIVSVKKHKTAKKEKRLVKAGYCTRKGKFGAIKCKTLKKRRSTRGYRKGTPSKTHPGRLDFTTKKGDKVFHRKGHYVRKSRKPYMK